MNYAQTIGAGDIVHKGEVYNTMIDYYRTGDLCFVDGVYFLDRHDGKRYNLPFKLDEVEPLIQDIEGPEIQAIF